MIRSISFLIGLMLYTSSHAELTFNELASLTKTPDYLQGWFKQEKYLKSIDISLSSSGQFFYQRDESIHWEILEPVQNVLLMTPSSMVNKQGETELARVNASENPTVAMISNIFFSVLTADWQAVEKYFKVSGEVNDSGWDVELTPIDDTLSQVMTRIILVGDDFLRSIVMYEKGGNQTTIKFSELEVLQGKVFSKMEEQDRR